MGSEWSISHNPLKKYSPPPATAGGGYGVKELLIDSPTRYFIGGPESVKI